MNGKDPVSGEMVNEEGRGDSMEGKKDPVSGERIDEEGRGDGMSGKDPVSGDRIDENGTVGDGVKFERIRRITGYLVGSVDRFVRSKWAKQAEVRDRRPHVGGKEISTESKGA